MYFHFQDRKKYPLTLPLLVVLFLWGISGKGNRRVTDGFDPDADNQFLNETKSKLLFNSRLWLK